MFIVSEAKDVPQDQAPRPMVNIDMPGEINVPHTFDEGDSDRDAASDTGENLPHNLPPLKEPAATSTETPGQQERGSIYPELNVQYFTESGERMSPPPTEPVSHGSLETDYRQYFVGRRGTCYSIS